MIKAVLFDLYETLITEMPFSPTRASSLAPSLGLNPQAYRVEWKARRPRVVLGTLSFAEALIEVSEALAGRADGEAIGRIRERRMREKAAAFGSLDPRVVSLINDLVRRGVTLGVVSNGFGEDVICWPGSALAPAFRCTAFSCEEGVAKPAPEIYRRAIRRLGVEPEATVYIGDGADDELRGAEQAGLRAYRAGWFVRRAPAPSRWPELAAPADVLKLVAAG